MYVVGVACIIEGQGGYFLPHISDWGGHPQRLFVWLFVV